MTLNYSDQMSSVVREEAMAFTVQGPERELVVKTDWSANAFGWICGSLAVFHFCLHYNKAHSEIFAAMRHILQRMTCIGVSCLYPRAGTQIEPNGHTQHIQYVHI